MAAMLVMILTSASLINRVVGQACEDDSSLCATRSRPGSAMLQSQTDTVKLDTGSAEVVTEAATLKSRLAAKPLVGKVMALEGEVGTLITKVKELQGKIGISTSAGGEAASEEASMLQRDSAPATKRALEADPRHHMSSESTMSRAGLIDATQDFGLEEDPVATGGDAAPVEDTGGPLKGRIASLEAKVTTLRSHVGTLEMEVLGRAAAALLQSKPGIAVKTAPTTNNSLKQRVLTMEDQVDSLKTRVSTLQHEVLG